MSTITELSDGDGVTAIGYYSPWLWGGPRVLRAQCQHAYRRMPLYIDLIDAKNKELVWQGRGVGTLKQHRKIEKKEERIREFVSANFAEIPSGRESHQTSIQPPYGAVFFVSLQTSKNASMSYESNHILEKLPEHLKQYIKPQDYEDYTAIDQAVWRYVMRKNVDYLSRVAHSS